LRSNIYISNRNSSKQTALNDELVNLLFKENKNDNNNKIIKKKSRNIIILRKMIGFIVKTINLK
jgi:ribosomal protein S19